MNVITATATLARSFAAQGLNMVESSEYPASDSARARHSTVFRVIQGTDTEVVFARVCVGSESPNGEHPWTILVCPESRHLAPRELYGNWADANDVWFAADITD